MGEGKRCEKYVWSWGAVGEDKKGWFWQFWKLPPQLACLGWNRKGCPLISQPSLRPVFSSRTWPFPWSICMCRLMRLRKGPEVKGIVADRSKRLDRFILEVNLAEWLLTPPLTWGLIHAACFSEFLWSRNVVKVNSVPDSILFLFFLSFFFTVE